MSWTAVICSPVVGMTVSGGDSKEAGAGLTPGGVSLCGKPKAFQGLRHGVTVARQGTHYHQDVMSRYSNYC